MQNFLAQSALTLRRSSALAMAIDLLCDVDLRRSPARSRYHCIV